MNQINITLSKLQTMGIESTIMWIHSHYNITGMRTQTGVQHMEQSTPLHETAILSQIANILKKDPTPTQQNHLRTNTQQRLNST